ncbi:hypothetical protein HOY82DRAFT_613447 [Tuber indicum]|nr:hypothetical protein HOY82DRAFT_613447 [Tuber indicum]
MQDLYDELWGKRLPVIDDCTFTILLPKHGFHLGYKVNLKEVDKVFLDPQFEKGKVEKVFKVLEVRPDLDLPCGTNQLLVRREFEAIESELLKVKSKKWLDIDSKTRKPAWHLNLNFQIAGQPGSGFWLVNQHKTDANYLFNLPEDRKRALWILTDGALTDEIWNEKKHGCLANREPPTPRQIAILFTIFTSFGPIARTCLQSISVRDVDAYNNSRDDYLGELDREIGTFIAQGGYQTVENSVHQHASYRMAIMHPTHNRRSYNARIATRWIAHKVYEKAQKKSKLRYFELYKQIARQKSVRTAAGWIFELHFFPFATNFESVDGLVFGGLDTLILFQITIAKSHDIKLRGVKQLCESIPATIKNIYLVFVIPEDCTSEYPRTQSVPEAGDVKPGAADLTINQFRLVLTEDAMRSMVTWGPSQV